MCKSSLLYHHTEVCEAFTKCMGRMQIKDNLEFLLLAHSASCHGGLPWGLKPSSVCSPSCFSRVQLFATPWTESARPLCPWDFPGKNTGVGCHSLLQGIFPTQGWNLGLPHCRQTLYHLSHQGRVLHIRARVSCMCSGHPDRELAPAWGRRASQRSQVLLLSQRTNSWRPEGPSSQSHGFSSSHM